MTNWIPSDTNPKNTKNLFGVCPVIPIRSKTAATIAAPKPNHISLFNHAGVGVESVGTPVELAASTSKSNCCETDFPPPSVAIILTGKVPTIAGVPIKCPLAVIAIQGGGVGAASRCQVIGGAPFRTLTSSLIGFPACSL